MFRDVHGMSAATTGSKVQAFRLAMEFAHLHTRHLNINHSLPFWCLDSRRRQGSTVGRPEVMQARLRRGMWGKRCMVIYNMHENATDVDPGAQKAVRRYPYYVNHPPVRCTLSGPSRTMNLSAKEQHLQRFGCATIGTRGPRRTTHRLPWSKACCSMLRPNASLLGQVGTSGQRGPSDAVRMRNPCRGTANEGDARLHEFYISLQQRPKFTRSSNCVKGIGNRVLAND